MAADTSMDTAPKRRQKLKIRLTDEDLRTRVSIDTIPEVGPNGKVKFVPRPAKDAGKPFYILIEGAPTGFGVYVGKGAKTYKVSLRGPSSFVRMSLGSVFDLSLEEAFELARAKSKTVRETGENPKRAEKVARQAQALESITIGVCMNRYIEKLISEKKKPSSISSARDSLARLSRKEVGATELQVRDIDSKKAESIMDSVRLSAMQNSNRIPTHLQIVLKQFADWSLLTDQELEELGIKGKYVQRVRSAGIAAAEHTISDATRAIDLVIKTEGHDAQREKRPAALSYNPLSILRENKKFRDARELRKHYERSRTRNPLEDKTLPLVLKSIVARRDEQGGMNRGAADYLLLTLLFGARRSENAQLLWFDRCTKSELENQRVSWVWLPDSPDEVNSFTSRPGPQIYFNDTKNNDERFLPVCYFAERILRQRLADRHEIERQAPGRILDAQRAHALLKKKTIDTIKLAISQRKIDIEVERPLRAKWVFPARSFKAKKGHYSDSKSILRNIRTDAGLLDLDKEVDIGLTPHDLRRTLGRYAGAMHRGPIVSQMLNHTIPQTRDDRMAAVSKIYTEQEWGALRRAFGEVEEAMISSSPRVWNRLKGTDKPRLDEANDPPAEIFKAKKKMLMDEEE